ncbi:TPA: hypothetical protein DIU27_01320 [Candidatus Collierbacteria bacterium]|nr:MAG: hypothetical protein UW56_C0023G0013 [Candidatus Collierbacteria bacterium GW2011_GWD1_44_27]KKT64863.1 MAG: hypothetical protein UW58_C0035G0002 [Candidatus Collierbacteria bacterium GW2011_GWC2_44_30]KKT68340.1 MAG: hypothetical protein UW64_C0022G0015 [Microgenomates group bacterium GW2011_GWC1_44_37]HCQ31011.1 hypothetical protein [Candidatus Collierbacteria bacterium]
MQYLPLVSIVCFILSPLVHFIFRARYGQYYKNRLLVSIVAGLALISGLAGLSSSMIQIPTAAFLTVTILGITHFKKS